MEAAAAAEQQQSDEAAIRQTKAELEAVQAMKDELAAAVAASEYERVQMLAKRLKVTELQQQLNAAVASDNFPEVARLGKELEECTSADQLPAEPMPEPEPEPPADLGAAAVWGSTPNDNAKVAYQAWQDDLLATEIVAQMGVEAEEDSETVDPDEMAALHFLDEPALQPPTVTVIGAADGKPAQARIRWRLMGTHREDPTRHVEMTTSRFRVSFKHSSWWTWQYIDIILNETPDCMRIAESEDGSCEFILKGEPGQLDQPGKYYIAMAPLYEFVEEWSVREWSEAATFVVSPPDEQASTEAETWCVVQ